MSHSHTSSRDQDSSLRAARKVELEPIGRDRIDTLNALFELYAHDFSEYVPLELGESGRFDVRAGDLWWSRDHHHPFFVRAAGRLAGFALVRRGSQLADDPEVMDVAEFFIVRGERRKRVGQRAACALLGLFPGRWEVRVRQANPPALGFWSHVLESVALGTVHRSTFSVGEVGWHVLRASAP
jgi:predicted acetyltransferase